MQTNTKAFQSDYKIKGARFFISLMFILGSYGAGSQSADSYVRQFMRDADVPGVFVAVVKRDSVIFQEAWGTVSLERGTPVSSRTCMELGSISKAFTDEAIFYLQHRGLLRLDESITNYFPKAPAAWSRIAIRQLMDHTSGIQNYLLDPRFQAAGIFDYSPADPAVRFFLDSISTDSITRMFYSLPLEFKPGETWSYSNTGYYLLGIIVERAARKPFFELVGEILTTPLNMKQTRANELAAAQGCLSPGYFKTTDGYRTAPFLSSRYAFAAGAWATTGSDMIEYMKAVHMHRLPADQAGYDWRERPPDYTHPFSYHLGRFHSIYKGRHLYLHNGGTPGFSASWIYVKQDSTSIIVLANRRDHAGVDVVARNILNLYVPSLKYEYKSMRGKQEMKVTKLIRKIVKAVKTGTKLPEGLSRPLKLFLDSENGRGLWKWIFESGYPNSVTCVDRETLDRATAYRFILKASPGMIYRISAITNNQGELAQLHWW